MDELKTNVLQLDQTKEDELIRIQNRPLDDALCNKYVTYLLDNHEMLERIETMIELNTEMLQTMAMDNAELLARIEELMQTQAYKNYGEKFGEQGIGQPIFTLLHQIDLQSELGNGLAAYISDIVMMNDGRLLICLPYQCTLQICNDDGSKEDRIHVHGNPCHVTVVNNFSVAVTVHYSKNIEMYDKDDKTKFKYLVCVGLEELQL